MSARGIVRVGSRDSAPSTAAPSKPANDRSANTVARPSPPADAPFGKNGASVLPCAPFFPNGASAGGLGLATVFALLSFAGFEGAAVLGAESLEPTRTIPRALIASVALAGVLYVFVAYAQTIGFGIDAAGSAAFAASASPLGDLAARYANAAAAALVMGGAAISALAAT